MKFLVFIREMWTMGEGVKKSKNFADIISGSPLMK